MQNENTSGPAATSGDAPTDELAKLKELALAVGDDAFDVGLPSDAAEEFMAKVSPAVVLDLIARLQRSEESVAQYQQSAHELAEELRTARIESQPTPAATSAESDEFLVFGRAGNRRADLEAKLRDALVGGVESAAAPAVSSGELPPLPDFFALGKTRINGVEHGHFSASQMQNYARAAVSAATKPTAELSPLPYSKAKSRALIVKGDIVFSVDEVEQIQREAYEFGKAQATAAVESIADELTDEAIPYEGDFADTVRGCADALRDLMRYEVVKLRDGLCEVPAPNTGAYVKFADVQSLLATKPAHRPTDDHLWDETIRDRDTYHEWADKLADAIATHFGVDIGEHSNQNLPWAEALEVIEGAAPMASTDAVIQAREQAPREVWSNNNEDFNFDTLDELLDDGEYKPGDTVWVGEAVKPDLSELIDADDVVDQMADRAGDIAGEHADGYPEVNKDDKSELDNLLSGWIARHCPPNFYRVENVRTYRLSADDFPNDRTPINAEFGTKAAGAEGAAS